MRIELSIKADYVPSWTADDGLREILQNAHDAETEFHAPMEVTYNKRSQTMLIKNTGVTLRHEAMLLGHTTKAARSDLIGQWGEGLKLGLLALVRAGRKVKIRSGSEVWTPEIIRSSSFDADVLAINIATGRKDIDRVSVEVDGVVDEESIRHKFLWMQNAEKVETEYGSLLLEARHAGHCFVKGIFVEFDERLSYGYDFQHASTDRDRKMVNAFDKRWETNVIWRSVVNKRSDLFDNFFQLLDDGADDIISMDANAASLMEWSLIDKVTAEFVKRYGENAIPVETLMQAQTLDHLGKKGILVSKALRVVVAKRLSTVDEVVDQLRREVIKIHAYNELNSLERRNLEESICLVSTMEVVSLRDIDVVDFRSPTMQGQYSYGKKRISISRKCLSFRNQCLLVLVHEVAHRNGLDGNKSHIAQIEAIWAGVVGFIRSKELVS